MKKLRLSGKELKKIGYTDKKITAMAMNMARKHYRKTPMEEVLNLLKLVLENPKDFLEDEKLGRVAEMMVEEPEDGPKSFEFTKRKDYRIYGIEHIDFGAIDQMEMALKLPVAVQGALMPDAHHGYGLPIGGVLATDNAVIPYGVGVDIGCRMCLTVHHLNSDYIERHRSNLKQMLRDNTRFGNDRFDRPKDHSVLERNEFREIRVVKQLKDKAWQQIGSSGSGNHFVEFGEVEITEPSNDMGLETGRYLAVLSHSGSRGLGANIARHYTELAMQNCKLPKGAANLAWLDLNSEAGSEYWLAMNLAGDYAQACHDQIHDRISAALGSRPIAKVENHHNFAWKEFLENGQEVIVHRKGATPAKEGELGIIPGSMTAPGFIVRGKGSADALNSASHGAGRKMSRSKAKASLTQKEVKQYIAKHGVTLIGGGLDEAPMAYKDISKVMASQTELVDVLGTFQPKLVRMCGR